MAKKEQREIGGLFEGRVTPPPVPISVASSKKETSNQRVTVRLDPGVTYGSVTTVQTTVRYSRRIVFSRKG